MYTWGYLKDVILSKLDLDENEAINMNLLRRFPFYANEAITQICSAIKPKRTFAIFEIHGDRYVDDTIDPSNIGLNLQMPLDFISFGDDVNTVERCGQKYEIHDEDFEYVGYNELMFYDQGTYRISYNARWFTFTDMIDDDLELPIPNDILDAIPSYVASQCMKIDDEQRAAVLRNEFEVMLARMDDTNFKSNKTFRIGGDW